MPGTLAVIGAGWAGLAAAVEGVRAGHAVTLYEMAGEPGGRAREVRVDGLAHGVVAHLARRTQRACQPLRQHADHRRIETAADVSTHRHIGA